MRRNRLGCLTSTGIIAALITAFAIAGYALAGGGLLYSPGPLNAMQGNVLGGVSSHAEIAGNCKACHSAPWEAETMDDRCSACHENVAAEVKDVGSVHGRMMHIDPNAKCRDCHPEHNGPTAMLTVLEGWKFPHEVADYSLKGHQFTPEGDAFLCSDCHGNDVTRFDPMTCRGCHSQMDMTFMVDHLVAFGESCLACHDGVDKYGHDFDHSKFAFALTDKHAAVSCAGCHMGAHTVTDLQAAPRDCFSCHQADDPHKGSLGADCASCHSPEGWKPAHFDHNRSEFKLEGAHANVACAQCHVNGLYRGTPKDCFSCHKQNDSHNGQFGTDCGKCHNPSDWKNATFDHSRTAFSLVGKHVNVTCQKCHKNGTYKGTPKECASCHVDVHFGQFGKDCAKCHSLNGWKPSTFDHNRTAFKLTGTHMSIDCKTCHVNGVFKGTPKDCFSCHSSQDVHKGQFSKDCAMCHTTSRWQNVSFDHSKTAFPLRGSHITVACKVCHKNDVFKGTPKDCFSCHAAKDVHEGQFGKDCATCHNPSGWKNVSLDHSKTAFPLAGLHTTVACKSCHVNGVYKGTLKDCFSCHAAKDAHGGQFGTNCASCHTASGWKNVSFDHGKTAFPLTGTHTTVTCKMCHVNGVYKGTPKDCYSCHAAKDKHGGQFGTDCASCHNTSGWKNVTFNHNNTAFPLTGGHTSVQCKVCHVNGVYKGTPKDCYSCHVAKDKHGGQFGTDCVTCHDPSSWANATFDHSRTTFPLVSTHATVACKSCHVNGLYKGTPKECYACHAARDVHGGQFGTYCGSCHKPTQWSDVTFNHNNTAFPLAGKHTAVACQSCHANGAYKGTPTDCFSCHAARDAHSGQFGTNCGSCHNPSGWANATFDHKNTSFPLVGHHAQLACRSCHGNGVYQGTPTQCIACHADKDKHDGVNGTDCSVCHTPIDWGKVQ